MSAIEYTRRAQQHRPTDEYALAREVSRLLKHPSLAVREVAARVLIKSPQPGAAHTARDHVLVRRLA